MAAMLPLPSIASAQDCRSIADAGQRLACWDERAAFDTAAQESITISLRIAQSAAIECGFVVDADRFKLCLVQADLSYSDLFARNLSANGQREIGDDADALRNEGKEAYCKKAWSTFGPRTEFGDNLFYK